MSGNLWFPRPVISEYVKNTNLLLDKRVRRDLSLTARETEVLRLVATGRIPVTTSARRESRTTGGFADHLRDLSRQTATARPPT